MRARIDRRARHALTSITARCAALDFARVLRAAVMLAMFNVAVRVRPARVLRSCPRAAKRGSSAGASPQRVVRAVALAGRFVGGTCLTRALVSQVLLARAGVPVTIVLGAESHDVAQLRAHAWIEHNGIPVVQGEPLPAFAAVWRFGADTVR